MRARAPIGDGRRARRSHLSLGTLLAVGLGSLMLLAVGSVLLLSFGGASRNTSALVRDKTDLVLSSIEQRIRQHLDPVQAQSAYLQGLIERGVVDHRNQGALGAALRASLAATPQVAGIAFIGEDLQTRLVERNGGSVEREDWSKRPEIAAVVDAFRGGERR